MNNEPNKPAEAEELTEKELEGVVGGATTEFEKKEERKNQEFHIYENGLEYFKPNLIQ